MLFQIPVTNHFHIACIVTSADTRRYLFPRQSVDKPIGENLPGEAVINAGDVALQAAPLIEALLVLGLNNASQIGNLRRILTHLVLDARGVRHPGEDLGARQGLDLQLLEAAALRLCLTPQVK